MAKTINIAVEFDDELPWDECYRRLKGHMGLAEDGSAGIIEGWESSDFEWFDEHGEQLSAEEISMVRLRTHQQEKHSPDMNNYLGDLTE